MLNLHATKTSGAKISWQTVEQYHRETKEFQHQSTQ